MHKYSYDTKPSSPMTRTERDAEERYSFLWCLDNVSWEEMCALLRSTCSRFGVEFSAVEPAVEAFAASSKSIEDKERFADEAFRILRSSRGAARRKP